MRALAFALAAALVACGAGYGLGRLGWRRIGLGLTLTLAAATLWTILTARQSPGMEGLARFLIALIFLAPATLGLGAGLWWGLRRR